MTADATCPATLGDLGCDRPVGHDGPHGCSLTWADQQPASEPPPADLPPVLLLVDREDPDDLAAARDLPAAACYQVSHTPPDPAALGPITHAFVTERAVEHRGWRAWARTLRQLEPSPRVRYLV